MIYWLLYCRYIADFCFVIAEQAWWNSEEKNYGQLKFKYFTLWFFLFLCVVIVECEWMINLILLQISLWWFESVLKSWKYIILASRNAHSRRQDNTTEPETCLSWSQILSPGGSTVLSKVVHKFLCFPGEIVIFSYCISLLVTVLCFERTFMVVYT